MNYIENIYICLAAPLFLAVLCVRKDARRSLTFILAGMTSCLLSAYVSTFLAGVNGVSASTAAYEISPAVEEILKFLPLLFYLLVFDPKKKMAIGGVLMISVGFATFENVCFLTTYGTSELFRLLVRGFGTGAMHVVCGMVVATGLFLLWEQMWLRLVGAFALLSFVITVHAIFNILVNQSGAVFWIGSAIPLTVVLLYIVFLRQRLDMS